MNPQSEWNKFTAIPALRPNDLHLFTVPLDISPQDVNPLKAILSPAEIERADRFVFPLQKTRFIACRAALRRLVGLYLSKDPASIAFDTGAHGKPRLADHSSLDLRFNLTHSEELAVFAVALSREVGVDIEKADPSRAFDDIAERYFSAQERRDFSSAPPADRVDAFFRCWTRKEAYVKARGDGLSVLSLDSFAVTLRPDEEPKIFATDSARWSMLSFVPQDGWIGAAVIEGSSPNTSKFSVGPV